MSSKMSKSSSQFMNHFAKDKFDFFLTWRVSLFKISKCEFIMESMERMIAIPRIDSESDFLFHETDY